ncbi:MAG: hypothetical protein WEA77_15125 [Hyphomonas sp.]|uniref:hypothetical protein n=1 Tax=Hyphomonas sp. TaxID=87 RepID=UPI0034A0768D
MLKFLVFALLVAAVIGFFALRQTPRRPPRDWRHGGDDGGPVPPTVHIGLDTGRKPANDAHPGDKPEPATTDSGAGDGD